MNKGNVKNLIVLDIDDTITKSEYQHQYAFTDAMKYFGINKINTNWEEYTHMTDSFILKENYETTKKKPFSFSLIEGFENVMTDTITKLDPVKEVPGAKSAVTSILENTNYGVCFATGSLWRPAMLKLTQTSIPLYENLVKGSNTYYSREEIVRSAILSAKHHYNVSKFENIISVGDGLWDLKTANNLGIHFIGIGEKNSQKFQAENIPLHISNWEGFDLKKSLKALGIEDN